MSQNSSTCSIKTDIFEFCQSFAGILSPFAASLEAARSGIRGKDEGGSLQRPLATFSDVQHRLESLILKVAEQQAYVIIFGPLKSGKSTLMNALSAAYVSEVTSLPAYPCLVQLKHGPEHSFVATRYNGEKLDFPDNASLQSLIHQNHESLAAKLREIEESGGNFDPGIHFPEAIRRVDVVAPTRNLKDSLTVLVDTPGLYTRMKFGYDLMTREFRNSAACAVFVVKTDNLFLEQVFEEFNQLLDLFSRIFLVVNIDTNKRDLDASGGLHPSLESSSPGEVIRAFESLVMSAPLRRAKEEGRLRIYPIDLLNSAASAMKEAAGTLPEPAASAPPKPSIAAELPAFTWTPENPPETSPESAPEDPAADISATETTADEAETTLLETPPAAPPESSFSVFLKDLTDYLNSSEYLQEFMGDSLLMGANLGLEVREQCSPAATESFEANLTSFQQDLTSAEAHLAAVEKLAALDLAAAFAPMREEAQRYAAEVSKAAAADTLKKATEALDTWFSTDQGVDALQATWDSAIDACARRVGTECLRKIHAIVAGPLGGIPIETSLRASVTGLDAMLSPVVESARTTLTSAEPSFQISSLHIDPEHLKVRKSLIDWLSLRSLAAVRRKLFGDPADMSLPVPAAVKEKRLGETGRQALKDLITSALSDRFPGEASSLSEGLLANYAETLNRELHANLQAGRNETTTRITTLTRRIGDHQAIRATLRKLADETDSLLEAIEDLRRKYRTYSLVESPTAPPIIPFSMDDPDPDAPVVPFSMDDPAPETPVVPFSMDDPETPSPTPTPTAGDEPFEDFAFIDPPKSDDSNDPKA